MRVGAVTVTLAVLAGCTGEPDDKGAAPAGQASSSAAALDPYVCMEACGAQNKEVKTTPCGKPADDVAGPKRPSAGLAKGSLSLRKSSAPGADCDRLYWARFEPDSTNTQGFRVVLSLLDPGQGQRYPGREQRSEPEKPNLAAFTVGLKVRPGIEVYACLLTLNESDLVDCVHTVVV